MARIMTRCPADKLNFARKLMMAAIGLAGVAGLVVFGLVNAPQIRAQSTRTTGAPLPSFEVISIKPNRSGAAHGMFRFLRGRFTGTCVPVILLMQYAYQVRDFQISGGPDWVRSENFDIEAKEPDELGEELQKLPSDQRWQKMYLLVQSMLADRFNLRVRQETKELPIYALVVGKTGHKLEKAKPGVGIEWHNRQLQAERGHITAQGVDMVAFVRVLSQQLGRSVADQTGLKGNYKLDLSWTPDPGQPGLSRGPADATSAADAVTSSDLAGPSIFTALQEQLGLKLESTKGPVEVRVIDHIERPSEN